VGHTNSSSAVVRESLAQFHKGNGVCRPGNLASDSAQVAEILVIGVLSVPRLIFRSVKGSLLRGSLLNAQLILLIDADLRDGLGFGDLGHVDGIGGVHRVRGGMREEEEKEEEGESEVLKKRGKCREGPWATPNGKERGSLSATPPLLTSSSLSSLSSPSRTSEQCLYQDIPLKNRR
jgi:hypothetical protein